MGQFEGVTLDITPLAPAHSREVLQTSLIKNNFVARPVKVFINIPGDLPDILYLGISHDPSHHFL